MQETKVCAGGAVLSLAMDLGKSMVKCGAEMNRVEETIIRVCYAYGMKRVEVFSIISMNRHRL